MMPDDDLVLALALIHSNWASSTVKLRIEMLSLSLAVPPHRKKQLRHIAQSKDPEAIIRQFLKIHREEKASVGSH